MDLTSKLRAIVRSGPPRPELTYEPDDGYRNAAALDPDYVASALGGRRLATKFGECMVIDRRYESDRWHGGIQIGECTMDDLDSLSVLDPGLSELAPRRTVFIDLETTGLSGGAGTVAFLVGCGYFDLGAFQVRQFLLTSYSSERALLAAVSEFFDDADLIVSYNGKTFDVPVMETRWSFHRMEMPLDGVPHFDMLHPARRLWSGRAGVTGDDGGCRLSTLERVLFDVERVGDVSGFEVPSRFFRFLRSGDPRPLEPVLEHNRLDLVSLAAVTARAARLAQDGVEACRDEPEALALGRVYERCGMLEAADDCYARAVRSTHIVVRAEALYRQGLRLRRERRYGEAATCWRDLLDVVPRSLARRGTPLKALRDFAAEALAIHHEHRDRDLSTARELALFALEEAGGTGARSDGLRHRLARLERKLARPAGGNSSAQLFS